MNCSVEGRLSRITGTWPETTSLSAGPAPLYGTCVMVVTVRLLNSSICMCVIEPVPVLA